MAKQAGSTNVIIKYLKNNKGQGLVEFAVILVFCIAIGIAARDAGMLDALNDVYSDTAQTAFVPSDIRPGETNVTGNLAAVDSTGGGTNTTSTGGGTGTGGGTSTPPAEDPSTPPAEDPSTPPAEDPSTPPAEDPSTPPAEDPSTPGIPGGGSTGEESGNQNQNTGLPAFSESNVVSYVAALYKKHKADGYDWQIKKNVEDEIMNDGNNYNLSSNVIGNLYGKTNLSSVDDWILIDIKKSNNWKMDTEDSSISNYLLTYMGNNNLNINDYNNCYTAAQNLISKNSYFNGLEDWRVIQMIQNANNTVLNENVYVGYLKIKRKFWSKNMTVSF